MFNFFRKKTVTKDKFPEIIDGLYLGVFLACSAATTVIHKRLKEIDPKFDIESLPSVQQKLFDMTFDIKGLYENLYGYQVTCVVGFLSQEKLIEFMDILVLKDMLLEKIESSTGMGRKEIESYNNKYLECGGDINCLNEKFSKYIIRVCEITLKDKNIHKIVGHFTDLAISLAMQTQANAARAFGDKKLAGRLEKKFDEYYYKQSYLSLLNKSKKLK
jgi:hypothetical protein